MPSATRPSLWNDRADDWRTAPDDEPPTRIQPPPPGPPGPRRRRAVAALGAAALIGAGAGAYATSGGSDDPAPQNRAAAVLPAAGGTLKPTDIGRIYEKASKAVVSVQVGRGSGTGFLIDREGTIVTNAHVVDGGSDAKVRFDDDGAGIDARVAGTDVSSDLAVLKVAPSAIPAGVAPLTLADSDAVDVGDAAIAIGYPLGLDRTATSGIVSGVGRQIEAPNGFSIDKVIQTDAPINPGNSGGPLIDAAGRVIGVNSQIATAGGGSGSVGIGFAVPSDTVREVVPQLQDGGKIARPWLGISSGESPTGNGVVVAEVTAGGPAQSAGLRAGDELVGIDGKPITDADQVSQAVSAAKPGDRISVEVRRGGATETISVELGTRPTSTGSSRQIPRTPDRSGPGGGLQIP